MFILREIEDQVPFINVHIEADGGDVLCKSWICNVVGSESERIRRFYDRVVLGIKVDCGSFQFTTSELRTGSMNRAIIAIPEENRSLYRPDYKGSIIAFIYHNLKSEKD